MSDGLAMTFAEVLDVNSEALDALLRAGVLAVVDISCRRLVTTEAILAHFPAPTRGEVRAKLEAIERRRAGHTESAREREEVADHVGEVSGEGRKEQ